MGSSTLNTLEEPLLQVVLHLKDDPKSSNIQNPKISENIFLEFSQDELTLFIDTLKKAL